MPKSKVLEPLRAISDTILDDGRRKLVYNNGAVFIAPPLPGGDWAERKAKELSDINYAILRRHKREQEMTMM